MAEQGGVVEGILGALESEEKEVEESAARADDIATAVMMDAARYDPELSHEASAYLKEQRALVRLQVHHFDEERRLAIEAAKRKRFSDHLRMSFQLFMALLGAAIGIGAIFMVHDAVTSRSVVIDPFDTPHALVERGITGKTVSAGLLDVLSRIQTASRAAVASRSLSNAWTDDIAIEVPETGLSIGQIERMLKARFGHDQHIDGDLVQTEKGGLALTVRGNGIQARTFSDDTRDLDKLLTEAGEYVYSQSQPGIWMTYLRNNGRPDDAIRFAQASYAGTAVSERPYVLNSWAFAIITKGGPGAARQALPLLREALRLKPDFWVGYAAMTSVLDTSGEEQEVVRLAEQMKRLAGGRPGRAPEGAYGNYDWYMGDLHALRADLIANLESHGGVTQQGGGYGADNLVIALIDLRLHDVDGAALRVQTTPVDEKNAPDVAQAAMDRALLAEDSGDWKTAADEWNVLAAAYANPAVSAANPSYMCVAAPDYEKTGQPAKADAALDAPMKAVGIGTFVDCYRFRADVLELRGDWAGARVWYAKAVKLAPSIPSAYYSWGMALAKHGDLDGAAAQFKDANQKGPHWADPLKAWGDVLMKQGHGADALAKYDAALRYAPNWKQLKQAREAAMKLTR